MGLRLKFNLAIIPAAAGVLAFVVWLDYRHEVAAIMAAHALHSAPIGMVPTGPVDPATLPEVVARWSLRVHVLYGLLLLGLVIAGVNTALHFFVFRPLDRMRTRVERMERGHWRDTVEPAGTDELGRFVRTLDILGVEIGAVVGHALHAERLAAVALLSHRLTAKLEPELGQVARVAVELNRRDEAATREAGEQLARSAASMLAMVRGLDAVFPPERRSRARK